MNTSLARLPAEIYRTNNIRSVVLDEADTLLDDSFSPLVLRVLNKLKVSFDSKEQLSGWRLGFT